MAAMVESLASCLSKQGHRVQVAGIGAEDFVRREPLGVFVSGLKHSSMIVRAFFELVGALRLAWRLTGGIRSGAIRVPQLVVACQPSIFLSLTSRFLKRRYGCKVYLVQRDLLPDWLLQCGRLKPGFGSWLLGKLKNRSLADADRVGIECEENLKFIPVEYRGKVAILDNWRDYSAASYDNAGPDKLTLVYGGRIGMAQGFERFLEALGATGLADTRFRIYCDARGAEELGRMTRAFASRGIELDIRSMLPESQFLEQASSCSLGVVTLAASMGTHNIPGKLLGYLAAGIPILAIGPRNSALGRIVSELGIGLYAPAEDHAAIVEILRTLADDPQRIAAFRKNVAAARSRFDVGRAACQIGALLS